MPLPGPPRPDQFHNEDEFLEAKAYYLSHVGRIKGLVKQAAQNAKKSPEQDRRTDAKAPAQGDVAAQTQQQVLVEIDTLIELIEQMGDVSEADEDTSYEPNSVMVMQAMDRLHQLLAIPSVGCDGQTAFAKKADVQ